MKIFSLNPRGYVCRTLAQRVAEAGHSVVGPEENATLDETISALLAPDVGALLLDLQLPGREADTLAILDALKAAPLTETHPGGYVLLGLSTVLTWNQTSKSSKRANKESAFRNRRCSPRYKGVRYLETLVLAAAKDGLAAHVLAPGILYGHGEEDLHYLFQQAWMHAGEAEFEGLPLIGDGKNLLPTIHVADLCSIVRAVLEQPPPESPYIVAVDAGLTSQRALVTAIAAGIGEGKVKQVEKLDEKVLLASSLAAASAYPPPEEAAALGSPTPAAASTTPATPATAAAVTPDALQAAHDLTNGNPELMLADMKFELEFLSGLAMEWQCEAGPAASAEGFETLRAEFVKERNLRPVRVMVAGAPGSGKSFYAERLARQLYVPHVRLADVIAQSLQRKDELAERVQAALVDSANQMKASKKSKDKARAKAGGSAQSKKRGGQAAPAPNQPADLSLFDTDVPRIPAYLLCKLVKVALRQPLCRNKGFILDGFPRTAEESRWLFSPDVDEDEAGQPLAQIEDRRQAARDAALNGEEEEEEDPNAELEAQPRDPSTMVDSAVLLEVSEQLAQARLQRLQPELVRPNHNDEEGFRRRWARHAAIHDTLGGLDAPHSPLLFVQDGGVDVLRVPESVGADPDRALPLMLSYVQKRGPAFNYHPTPEEVAEEARLAAEKEAAQAAAQRATEEEQAAQEAAHRAALQSNASQRRAAVLLEDALLLEAASQPIRAYLLANVVPALVDGLLDVCKTQPDDPVDALAEHLFNYAVGKTADTENDQDRPQL